jgi:hypothetical protein
MARPCVLLDRKAALRGGIKLAETAPTRQG